jgi:hypothetical protein
MPATLRTEQNPTEFSFQAFVPQEGPGDIIKFPAFINSINDNHNPSWTSNMDIGRADPKMKYGSYSRNISVNFVTAALYDGEHKYWLEVLNNVVRQCRPTYKPGKGFNGVFTKMKIGHFISEYGILTSFSLDVNNDTPWIDKLPIYINCSLSFQVVGEKKLDYKNKGDYYFGKYEKGKMTPG